jgi:hypothetical protein
MARKLKGGAIQANTVTTTQMNDTAWAQVYSALAAANAAYAQANTANTSAASASGGFAKSFLTGL